MKEVHKKSFLGPYLIYRRGRFSTIWLLIFYTQGIAEH
jgi:hypothetical protein